jgi:hypothetical protein
VRRHAATLRAALSLVRAQLGSLRLEGSPEGAAVRIDGDPAGALPSPALRVRAGTVVVRVEAPGHHPIERRVSVEAGASVREEFRLVAVAPAPPPAPAPPVLAPPPPVLAPPPPVLAPPPPVLARTRPWAGLAVLGVGVASLATGATLAVLSAAAAPKTCRPARRCCGTSPWRASRSGARRSSRASCGGGSAARLHAR